MDINDVRGLIVLAMLLTFLGLFAWAWSRRNRQRFDEAAQLPFADEPDTAQRKDDSA